MIDERMARERLAVLQLAEQLGNASEACRRSGVDRTSFHQWKRRYAREGIAGLRNRPPVRKSHPQTTPADVSRRIVALALAHPARGCDRIAKELARHGIEISGVTIQKIMHKARLATYETRGAALEVLYAEGRKKLSAEQVEFLETINPCFRERGAVVSRPGEVLCQGMFFLSRFEGLGPVYVHAIVDGCSAYAFGVLATTTRIDPAIAALRGRVLPFFAQRTVTVSALFGTALGKTSTQMIYQYLHSHGIEHRIGEPGITNGFVERFRRIAITEFLRRPFVRRRSHPGLEPLQSDFDDWLASYNEARAHGGYPNYGATPASMIAQPS